MKGSPPRPLVVLLLAAAALFTANAWTLSLPALDDCFYARKGVEMARGGPSFTVTINGQPTFQNPPLAFWILGASFRVFGENDFAARLPSILMALGLIAIVWRIGALAGGADVAAVAGAMLLLTHGFANQARRNMLEIPLTFWVALAMLVLVEGRRRPRRLPLLALPLAGAILTKSVLGLLPLILLAAAAALLPEYRALLRRPGLWIGAAAGLLIGASWPIHQWLTFGAEALRQHFLVEIAARAAARFDLRDVLLGYPKTLLVHYQPVIVPAVVGAVVLWRRRAAAGADAILAVLWAVLPVLLYSASSARSARYVYPTLPGLALCAGYWIARDFPRVGRALATWVAPGVALAAAAVFWIRPGLLAPGGTAAIKDDRALRERVPRGETLVYLGSQGNYWSLANPLLYYQERSLDFPAPSTAQALDDLRARASGLLVADRARLHELGAAAAAPIVIEGRNWVVLDMKASWAGPDKGER